MRFYSNLTVSVLPGCFVIAQRALDALTLQQRDAVKTAVAKFLGRFEMLGKMQDEQLLGGVFEKQGLHRVAAPEGLRSEFFEAARAAREQLGSQLVPAELLTRVMALLGRLPERANPQPLEVESNPAVRSWRRTPSSLRKGVIASALNTSAITAAHAASIINGENKPELRDSPRKPTPASVSRIDEASAPPRVQARPRTSLAATKMPNAPSATIPQGTNVQAPLHWISVTFCTPTSAIIRPAAPSATAAALTRKGMRASSRSALTSGWASSNLPR